MKINFFNLLQGISFIYNNLSRFNVKIIYRKDMAENNVYIKAVSIAAYRWTENLNQMIYSVVPVVTKDVEFNNYLNAALESDEETSVESIATFVQPKAAERVSKDSFLSVIVFF